MSTDSIRISRDFFESEEYLLDRFSRREAFLDLCYLAAYKDKTFKIRGILIEQKVGQVARSLRDLALRWRWSVNTVVKYINELKEDDIIDTQQTSVIQLITIKKYLLTDTQTDTQIDTQTDTQTDTPINNNINNLDNKLSVELEKSTTPKQRRKPVYKTLVGKCREKFEEFYKSKIGEEYQFNPADGNNMKLLLTKIRSSREKKEMPIDDESMISAFEAYLKYVEKDEWLLSNLSVKVINSKYNEIVAHNKKASSGMKVGVNIKNEIGKYNKIKL